VQSSVGRALERNVENLVLTGNTAIDGTGNDLNNTLVGNEAANLLQGGSGNDIYVIGPGDSVVELADGGIDTVYASVACTLSSNVENLTLTGSATINGTGNTLDNVLIGNDATNTLTGGVGNDTYVIGVGDTVLERHGAGQDTVISSASYMLGNNVENLMLSGTESISGAGNSLDNHLFGNSQDNVLNGLRGNDTMVGGGGADVLDGGAGNDTYVFDRNDGLDVIRDFQKKPNVDILSFGPDISAEQIWFRQSGNDLEISIIGTQDSVSIQNWYLGSAYHVEQITLADGNVLPDTQVQALVDAMAAFAPPPEGQSTLPQDYQNVLLGLIDANWTINTSASTSTSTDSTSSTSPYTGIVSKWADPSTTVSSGGIYA